MVELATVVKASKDIEGGNRKLVESVDGAYLVIDQVAGKIRRLLVFGTEEEAWQAWREDEDSVDNHREHYSAGGAAVYHLARP